MVPVTGNNELNKRAMLSQYSEAEDEEERNKTNSEAEDEEERKKTNYESDADEGIKKQAAVGKKENYDEYSPKREYILKGTADPGFHTEVGTVMPDLDLSVAPSSSTGLFIKYMLTMKPSPQHFTVDTVDLTQDELLKKIESEPHCLLGRSSKFPDSLLLIHSLFVNEGEILGFTNSDGYGSSETDPATIVHIPSTLLLTEMSGLCENCFSTKRGIRSTPQFPTSKDFLTDGVPSFFANAPDPDAVPYSVTDYRAGDCILISPHFFGFLAHKRQSSSLGYHVTVADILYQLTALKNKRAGSLDAAF